MTDYSAAEKFTCADRELKMRERVYPRWIEAKKMTAEKAAKEIAVMAAIAHDYEAQVEQGRLL